MYPNVERLTIPIDNPEPGLSENSFIAFAALKDAEIEEIANYKSERGKTILDRVLKTPVKIFHESKLQKEFNTVFCNLLKFISKNLDDSDAYRLTGLIQQVQSLRFAKCLVDAAVEMRTLSIFTHPIRTAEYFNVSDTNRRKLQYTHIGLEIPRPGSIEALITKPQEDKRQIEELKQLLQQPKKHFDELSGRRSGVFQRAAKRTAEEDLEERHKATRTLTKFTASNR